MAAPGALNPSDYIAHHLTNLTVKVGEGGFWTVNMDTIVMSWVLGLVGLGVIWMVARGATADTVRNVAPRPCASRRSAWPIARRTIAAASPASR